MISWRARRQLVVVLIFALMVGGLGFWLLPKVFPEPTCFDHRRNQGETAVDCGGPCAPCELKNPKPLAIFWAKAVPVRPNTYDVAAEVENSNEVLSASKAEYEFTLFDGATPVAFKRGSVYLFSQERMHAIEANVMTTRSPTSVEFKIIGVSWEFRSDPKPNIVVERRDYAVEEDNGLRRSVVQADIVNRAPRGFKEAEVRFVILDREGNLMGANRILVENFLAGSKRTVKSIWPLELTGEPVQILVEPRVNVFDPGIILKP